MYSLRELYDMISNDKHAELNFTSIAAKVYGVSEQTILLYQRKNNMEFPFITLTELYNNNKGKKEELKTLERKIKLKKIISKI